MLWLIPGEKDPLSKSRPPLAIHSSPPLSCPFISVALSATPYEPVAVLPPSSPSRRTLCRRLAPWCHVLHTRWP